MFYLLLFVSFVSAVPLIQFYPNTYVFSPDFTTNNPRYKFSGENLTLYGVFEYDAVSQFYMYGSFVINDTEFVIAEGNIIYKTGFWNMQDYLTVSLLLNATYINLYGTVETKNDDNPIYNIWIFFDSF